MLFRQEAVRIRTVWSVDRLLETNRKILVEIPFFRPIPRDNVTGDVISLFIC